MAFATAEDVAVRMGRELSEPETSTVEAMLTSVAAMITQAAGRDDSWAEGLDPVPEILKTVSIEAVSRGFSNPQSLSAFSESIGSYQYSQNFTSAGLGLTTEESLMVKRAANESTTASPRIPSVLDDIYPLSEDVIFDEVDDGDE